MFHRPVLSERGKEIATGMAILVLVFGGLGAGEAALRIMNFAKFGVAETVEKSAKFHIDPLSGIRAPIPGAVLGKATMNSLGYRSPEIPLPKPSGVIRLAFFGSSTTFDTSSGGSIEESWPYVTWQALQDALPACRLDYVNAGVPGYRLTQMETYFERNVVRVEPDVVLVMAADLDADASELAESQGLVTNLDNNRHWLAQHSVLFAKLWKNFEIIRLQRTAFRPAGHLRFDPQELARPFQEKLAGFVALAREKAATVVLLMPGSRLDPAQSREELAEAANTALYFMPFMSIPGLLAGRAAYDAAIERAAQDTGALLMRAARGVPKDALHYFDSAHFTPAGSRAMGTALASELLASAPFRSALAARGCEP